MKKYIQASNFWNPSDILLQCLAEYIGSGLVIDYMQLQKYPKEEWVEQTKSIYKDEVYDAVYEFMEDNFEGWYVNKSDDIASQVWSYLLSDSDFMLDLEESLNEF